MKRSRLLDNVPMCLYSSFQSFVRGIRFGIELGIFPKLGKAQLVLARGE